MTSIFTQLLQDPINQVQYLTSGDPIKMAKSAFAPSLTTQDQGGMIAAGSKLADNIIAGYFGGPFGRFGSSAMHYLNDSYTGNNKNRKGGLFGV